MLVDKKMKYLQVFGGSFIAIRDEDAEAVEKILGGKSEGFFRVGGNLIRISSVMGLYSKETAKEMILSKNGSWKCKFGSYHTRNQICDCRYGDNPEGGSILTGYSREELATLPEPTYEGRLGTGNKKLLN